MKSGALLTLIAATLASSALAGVPEPYPVEIEPWNTYGRAFVTPGSQSGTDSVLITVLNADYEPISNAVVDIDLSNCEDLCICNPDGLTGVTDQDGQVRLNPRVGGSEECPVIVRANAVTIGVYEMITSTDWGSNGCDGVVGAADLAFFGAAFNATQNPRADYNGDGWVGGVDLSMFAASFISGDGCR